MKITEKNGTVWITNKVEFVDNSILFDSPSGGNEEVYIDDIKSIEND